MLTLAFAQIVWALIFQWDDFTGGSNGLVGIRAAEAVASPLAYYYLALACAVLGVYLLRRVIHAPFGLALRAARDAGRAEALGMDVRSLQWGGFAMAACSAGWPVCCSPSPRAASRPKWPAWAARSMAW
jgi:branched-chain amino acid transport system permease protein